MKAFRLINRSELQSIKNQFLRILDDWNLEYCLFPISLELRQLPANEPQLSSMLIDSIDKPIVQIEASYCSFFNFALFGVDKDCFNSVSDELFKTFLSQMLNLEICSLNHSVGKKHNWSYPGSCSLMASLHCSELTLHLIFSPEWVIKQLPTIRSKQDNLTILEDVLDEQSCTLTAELDPLTISLKQLLAVRKGDVITLEHSILKPLRLTQKDQLFSYADLGRTSSNKSIILRKPS